MHPMETRHASEPEERLTIGQAALLAGVSVDTLRRWADTGKVPSERRPSSHRVFRRADIEAIHQPQSTTTPDHPAAERAS